MKGIISVKIYSFTLIAGGITASPLTSTNHFKGIFWVQSYDICSMYCTYVPVMVEGLEPFMAKKF